MKEGLSPLETILACLRCARCTATPLARTRNGVRCTRCQADFSLNDGILDMLGESPDEVITPFQRIMQSPPVVSIYERIWRPTGYYLASSRSFSREIRTVLGYRRGREDALIMDLACGPGVFTRPLARESGGIVVGFDLSLPMMRHAHREVDRDGLRNVVLIRGTVFQMPFIDASFSYVNCCGALHLFDRPDAALSEMRRILAPQGRLCVQTTIRPARSAGFAWLLERFIRFGFFEESDLRRRLDRQGFDILASERNRISYTFLAARR